MYEGNPVDLRMEKTHIGQMEFLMKRQGSAGLKI